MMRTLAVCAVWWNDGNRLDECRGGHHDACPVSVKPHSDVPRFVCRCACHDPLVAHRSPVEPVS